MKYSVVTADQDCSTEMVRELHRAAKQHFTLSSLGYRTTITSVGLSVVVGTVIYISGFVGRQYISSFVS